MNSRNELGGFVFPQQTQIKFILFSNFFQIILSFLFACFVFLRHSKFGPTLFSFLKIMLLSNRFLIPLHNILPTFCQIERINSKLRLLEDIRGLEVPVMYNLYSLFLVILFCFVNSLANQSNHIRNCKPPHGSNVL